MRPVVAVDLGGTNIRAAFFPEGQPPAAATTSRPTRAAEGAPAVLDHIHDAIEALAIPVEARAALAIGIGAPGPLDRTRGVVLHAPNLPGWDDIPLAEILGVRWKCPVFVENDANLATLGEWMFGAGQGAHHLVMLTIGTGIGGGVIVDDRLVRGARGMAGELGHIPIQLDGPICSCGQPGHLEALASGTAIARTVREGGGLSTPVAAPGDITAAVVAAAAAAGDPVAGAAMQSATRAIGVALAGLAHIFNPERFVLGGGVARAGEGFFQDVETTMRAALMDPSFGDGLTVLPSALEDDAALLGGLALVLEG